MKIFVVTIDETGTNRPGQEEMYFNQIREYFKTLDEARQYIKDRYGKIPSGKRRVFVGEGTPIGFLYSFWNKDMSHNTKHWFQTDWIVVHEKEKITTPVLIN